MKTRIGMIVLGVAMLASCTQENGNTSVSTEGMITLGVSAGGNGTLTRGVVNSLAALSADGANVGVYGVQTANTDASQSTVSDWTAAPLMNNVRTTSVNAQGMMGWANPESYFYPKNASKNYVRFFAYYPYDAATVTAPSTGSGAKLNFTLTGGEDVMWATPVIGTRSQPASKLGFKHKLTQFTFVLVDNENNFNNSNGAVTDLTITAHTTATLDVETGVLGDWGTEKSLAVFSGQNYTLDSATPLTVDKVLMLEPGKASFDMELTAAGTSGSPEVKRTVIKPVSDATFEAGKHYVITLSLSGNVLIQLGASVEEWLEGSTGIGIID